MMTVPKKKAEVELNNGHHHSNTWCPLLRCTSAFFFDIYIYIYLYIYIYIYIYGLLAGKVLAHH